MGAGICRLTSGATLHEKKEGTRGEGGEGEEGFTGDRRETRRTEAVHERDGQALTPQAQKWLKSCAG